MKAYLEIVKLDVTDVVTTSPGGECCDWGCPLDFDQAAGNY